MSSYIFCFGSCPAVASNILAAHVYTILTRQLWKNSQNTVKTNENNINLT